MSTMFRGQFEHAIDAKGRTSFPSRFRDSLAADNDLRVVLTRALDEPCLHIHPMRGWETRSEGRAAPQFDSRCGRLRRVISLRLSSARSTSRDASSSCPTPRVRRADEGRRLGGHGQDRRALVARALEQGANADRGSALESQDRNQRAVPPMSRPRSFRINQPGDARDWGNSARLAEFCGRSSCAASGDSRPISVSPAGVARGHRAAGECELARQALVDQRSR